MSTQVPPGWRADPSTPGQERWWTGRDWTDHVRPIGPADFVWAPAPPAAAPATVRTASPAARVVPPRPRRPWLLVKTVLVGILVALALLVAVTPGGVGGLLVVLALMGLVVGVYALIRGRSATFRIRGRGRAVAVLVGSLIAFVAGGATLGATGATPPPAPAAAPASSAAPARVAAHGGTPAALPRSPLVTATPTPTPTAAVRPAAGSALAVLATLPVKGRAPMTGYARTADFGSAWLDVNRNGCDTRNDILRRDLTDTTGSGCRVLSGVLADPYTRTRIDFVRGVRTSTAVQIDHVVALGDAWQTGAQQLSQAQRIDLANDPINLFAVDGPTNEQKSDSDAASWLPPNKAFRCTYVAHQVGVKKAYGLWVTAAERTAMQRILASCPSTAAPTSAVSHVVLPAATAKRSEPVATKKAGPKKTVSGSSSAGVDPRYDYCYEAEAHGAHTPYYRGKDPEYAWYTDRDGDGVVCEP